jgi:hypothetical protein
MRIFQVQFGTQLCDCLRNPSQTHRTSFPHMSPASAVAEMSLRVYNIAANAQYIFVSMNEWSCTVPLLSLSVSCSWRTQNICSVFVLIRQNPNWWSLVFSAAYDLLLPWYCSRCNDQAADWKLRNRGSILRWDKRPFPKRPDLLHAHPASNSVVTRGSFPRVETAGASSLPLPSRSEVKKEWSYNFTIRHFALQSASLNV